MNLLYGDRYHMRIKPHSVLVPRDEKLLSVSDPLEAEVGMGSRVGPDLLESHVDSVLMCEVLSVDQSLG